MRTITRRYLSTSAIRLAIAAVLFVLLVPAAGTRTAVAGGEGTEFTHVSVPGTGRGFTTSVTCGFLSGCQARLEVPDSISGLLAGLSLDASDRLASVSAFQKLADALPPIPTPPRPVKIAAGALSQLVGGVDGIAMDMCGQHLLTCYVVSNVIGGPFLANQMVVSSMVLQIPGVKFTVEIRDFVDKCRVGGCLVGILRILVQVLLDLISVDPADPDYQSLMHPQPAQLVQLTGQNLTPEITSALQREIQGLLNEVADIQSLITSVNRAQGARQAKAYIWEYRQLQVVGDAANALARDVENEHDASSNLATVMPWTGGTGLTAQQVSADQAALTTDSLPAGEHELVQAISAGAQEKAVVDTIRGADPAQVATATGAGLPGQLTPAGQAQGRQALSSSLDDYGDAMRSLPGDDPVIGWAVGQRQDGTAGAWHSDDGVHWSAVRLPGAYAAWQPTDVAFPTLQDGWISAFQGLLHTTDGGKTWNLAASGEYDSLQFPDADHGFAMGQRCGSTGPCGTALLGTSDGGKTWRTQTFNAFYADFQFLDAAHGWLAGPDLQVTTDGGRTWRSEPTGFPAIESVAFTDPQHGFVLADQSAQPGRLLLATSDGGATWQQRPLPTGIELRSIRFGNASEGWIIGSSEHGGGAALFTLDGGTTWQRIAIGAPTVTSISPASGPTSGCGTVTIHGTGFDAGQLVMVTFGAADASDVRVVDSGTILAGPPPASSAVSSLASDGGPANSVFVGVWQIGGVSAAPERYTYDPSATCASGSAPPPEDENESQGGGSSVPGLPDTGGQ